MIATGAATHQPGEEQGRVQGRGAGRGPVGLVGAIGELLGGGFVGEAVQGEGVAGAVAGEAQREGTVILAHPDAGMDVEARVRPLEHPLGLILVEEAAVHEQAEHGAAEGLAEGGAVVGGPAGPAHEGAVGSEAAVGDDEMEMGMPVGQRAVGLETGDDPDPEVGLPRGGADARGDDAGRQPREIAEEGPAVEAVGPEPLGDREDHLAVRDGGEERLVQPEGPAGQPLGVAAGAEVAALAGEGEQVLVGAGVAADAGEAVLQDAAGEKPVDHRGDDGAPRAVGMGEPLVVDQAQVPEAALEQAIERGGARPARPVDGRGPGQGLGARRRANPMLVVCDSRTRRSSPLSSSSVAHV